MRKHRRLLTDLLAFTLFLGWLLVVGSIVTHDPADPPLPQAFPAHTQAHNLLGEPGAWCAGQLTQWLGITVYPALAAGFLLVLTLLLEGRRGSWLWRLLGWQLLIPGVALAADWAAVTFPPTPILGAGGLLGATLHDFLQASLTTTGMLLVMGAGLLGGIGLAGDFLWPRLYRFLRGRLAAWRRYREAKRQQQLAEIATIAGEPQELEALTMVPVRRVEREVPTKVMGKELMKAKPEGKRGSDSRSDLLPINRGTAPQLTSEATNGYELPPFDLLEDPKPFDQAGQDEILRDRATKLEKVCQDFNVNVQVVGINTGPVVTQYEIALETGLRVNKVTSLSEDLALNLKVPSVRIVAPLPGRDTVGIEIPNEHRAEVKLKEVILASAKAVEEMKIPLFLGKDAEGQPLVHDLAEMPHLLIAGRTGTGKSVCMNAIIVSILMTRRPDQVKMIMIDPKMLEMNEYSKMPHLMHPVVKDMKKAEAILAWAVDKMEERYDILSRARVRNIASYNQLSPEEIYRRVKPADEEERERIPQQMPYIVIFVDEMADLMMQMRKEVEGHIIRLAQKSRAAGIHLIVATQKPTVDVITGLIKSNLPARICFQVASRTDSRVVLDEMGAEKLLGRGDMLFLQPNTSSIIRAQGTYLRDQEIAKVVDHLECEPDFAKELMQLNTKRGRDRESLAERDALYEDAIEIVVREQRGSVSLLQRALGIGYGRAARLIDFMAEDGYVGPYNGQSAREVLLTPEEWEKIKGVDASPEAA
jgi:S-DNA-T family DNA segregation ATPase FtsK/SpoIIIE